MLASTHGAKSIRTRREYGAPANLCVPAFARSGLVFGLVDARTPFPLSAMVRHARRRVLRCGRARRARQALFAGGHWLDHRGQAFAVDTLSSVPSVVSMSIRYWRHGEHTMHDFRIVLVSAPGPVLKGMDLPDQDPATLLP